MRILFVTCSIILLDQATKLWVKGFTLPIVDYYHHGMLLGQSIPVLGDFLRLTFVENPGMAFGIEVGSRWFLSLFSLCASIGIFYYITRLRNDAWILRFTLALILGGAIGNLIDRCFYGVLFGEAPFLHGKVVDFIDVDFFHIDFLGITMDRFAVFNVADASVSVGIVLMLIFYKKFSEAEAQRLPREEKPLSPHSDIPDNPSNDEESRQHPSVNIS